MGVSYSWRWGAPLYGGSSLRGIHGLLFQPEDYPGYRNNMTGALNAVGERGYCSSSSVSGTNMLYLWFTPQDLKPGNTDNRATGRQVRCLQAFIRTPLFSLPLTLRNAPVGCFTGLPIAVYGISGRENGKFSSPPAFSRDGKGPVKATLAGQLQSLRAGGGNQRLPELLTGSDLRPRGAAGHSNRAVNFLGMSAVSSPNGHLG